MANGGGEDDITNALMSMLGQHLIMDAAARVNREKLQEVVDQEGAAGLLRRGVTTWNMWRQLEPRQWIDLGHADLKGLDLREARLNRTTMVGSDLSGARLCGAILTESHLTGCKFDGADLTDAILRDSDLTMASFVEADLTGAKLMRAMAIGANFTRARMSSCELRFANLTHANLSNAVLVGSELTHALLVGTNVEGASLSSSQVYGISAWDLKGEPADQLDLVITPRPPPEVPRVTVDDLRVAQLIYVMLSNGAIRNVIDTVTSRAVLILGRFGDHLPVLHSIRDELRRWNYLPIVFDFEQPGTRDLAETVSTLAHLARFVIMDLTDPRSVPVELLATIPNLPSVAFQPIVVETDTPFAMFDHWRRYPWVMPLFRYRDRDHLITSLEGSVISPTEAKVAELRREYEPPPRPQPSPIRPRPAAMQNEQLPSLPSSLLEESRSRLLAAAPSPLSAEQQVLLRELLIRPQTPESPRRPADHLFLGNCYEEVSDWFSALAEYSAAIAQDPGSAEIYFNRARIYHRLGQLQRAVEDNHRALERRPDLVQAYFNRAMAYRAQGELAQAISDLTRFIATAADSAAYHERGVTHLRSGNIEQAIADFGEELRLGPESGNTYYLRALAHEQLDDNASAAADYLRAIELTGERVPVLLAVARVERRRGAHAEAVARFTRALQLEPASGEAYRGRGAVRHDLGDLDGAISDYTQATDILSDRSDTYADRGFTYSAQGRYVEAIADYDTALRTDPDHFAALYNRACAYSLARSPGSIANDLRRAIDLNPSLAEHARADDELAWAREEIPAVRELLG